jgi:methylmalonyl-CoA mutase, N-terminal domain
VIAEESGVANTVDPLGGSWFVEALTNETEQAVWRYLDEIDARGGMVAAVEAGYPQREIADAAYRYQRELEAGERIVVGVNRHVDASEALRVPVLQVPEGSLARQLARLARTRRERDTEAVGAALAALHDAASRPESSATNLMPHFIRCADAYATLGEQCAVLRDVFGEYREPAAI